MNGAVDEGQVFGNVAGEERVDLALEQGHGHASLIPPARYRPSGQFEELLLRSPTVNGVADFVRGGRSLEYPAAVPDAAKHQDPPQDDG